MEPLTYAAFAADRLVAQGSLEVLLRETKGFLDRGGDPGVLVFEDQTGRQLDFDFRGDVEQVLSRALPPPAPPGPGRPRLGVVAREVTLLPQHWEWLAAQPSGVSGTLRRLVDAARKRAPGEEAARRARDATGRFLTAIAGDRPGYEEATRALYAGDRARFEALVRSWPRDVRAHAARLARPWFGGARRARARGHQK